MPRGTFVVFRIDRFPEAGGPKSFKTEEKRPRGSDDRRADPVFTAIRFDAGNVAPDGFSHCTITHRKGVKIDGVWHGNVVREIVQEKRFDSYFSRNRGLFIAEVEKEIALSAAEALSSDDTLREFFRFKSLDIDFSRITPRAINVIGAWFKGMKYANIRTEAAFGNHILVDPEFVRMAQHGNQSNLVVVIDFRGTQMKVNISKIGSAFFMENYPLDTCLGFMEDLLNYQRPANL